MEQTEFISKVDEVLANAKRIVNRLEDMKGGYWHTMDGNDAEAIHEWAKAIHKGAVAIHREWN